MKSPRHSCVSRFTFHLSRLTRNDLPMLADFFSILLVRLLGTVKADAKLGRTMVGFAATTRTGDLGFPVCGLLIESAEGISTLGDGGPGLVGTGDIGHKAACGEGNATAL